MNAGNVVEVDVWRDDAVHCYPVVINIVETDIGKSRETVV